VTGKVDFRKKHRIGKTIVHIQPVSGD
jgi:hypothetical protein